MTNSVVVVQSRVSLSRVPVKEHTVDLNWLVWPATSDCQAVGNYGRLPSEVLPTQLSKTSLVVDASRSVPAVVGYKPERWASPRRVPPRGSYAESRDSSVETGRDLDEEDWGSSRNSWRQHAVIRLYQLMVVCSLTFYTFSTCLIRLPHKRTGQFFFLEGGGWDIFARKKIFRQRPKNCSSNLTKYS